MKRTYINITLILISLVISLVLAVTHFTGLRKVEIEPNRAPPILIGQSDEEDILAIKQYKTPSKAKNITISSLSEENQTEVMLLARLIHAEAGNQPYEGKIAVANVVLNRVKSPDFPNTIKDVIFQKGQFTPVANKKINNTPTEEDIKAAKEALEGVVVLEDALYFENSKNKNNWIKKNREFITRIGEHNFYR
ncbi:cell wall hydrolase [Thermicanus aegyptius]|uniref:cell wall hydrolase n=1 Tax=Thermicanus aegyptius TaxID=94009 RepID=UPI0004149880|nr:cell wall hydrolase [Thermicanus aegyptius]